MTLKHFILVNGYPNRLGQMPQAVLLMGFTANPQKYAFIFKCRRSQLTENGHKTCPPPPARCYNLIVYFNNCAKERITAYAFMCVLWLIQ